MYGSTTYRNSAVGVLEIGQMASKCKHHAFKEFPLGQQIFIMLDSSDDPAAEEVVCDEIRSASVEAHHDRLAHRSTIFFYTIRMIWEDLSIADSITTIAASVHGA